MRVLRVVLHRQKRRDPSVERGGLRTEDRQTEDSGQREEKDCRRAEKPQALFRFAWGCSGFVRMLHIGSVPRRVVPHRLSIDRDFPESFSVLMKFRYFATTQ